MGKKVQIGLCMLVILIALIVSVMQFGMSPLFVISLVFIAYVALVVLQDMDNRGLLTIITLVGPIISRGNFSNTGFQYSMIIPYINNVLSSNHIPYAISKSDIDILVVYIALIIVINLFSKKDNSTLGKHLPDKTSDLLQKEFKEENEKFCKLYAHRINKMEIDYNWQEERYVPLSSEVRMLKGHKIKRYDDLVKCLKKNKGTSFSLLDV